MKSAIRDYTWIVREVLILPGVVLWQRYRVC